MKMFSILFLLMTVTTFIARPSFGQQADLNQSLEKSDSRFNENENDTSFYDPTPRQFVITEAQIDAITIKFQKPLEEIEENMRSYINLIQVFNQFKIYDTKLVETLLEKIKNHHTLSGEELFDLRRTVNTYYKINKKILDFAKVYDFGGFKMSKSFAFAEYNIPLVKAHLIWLSGHLLVLDHLSNMHNLLYDRDGVFRRIVKKALLNKDRKKDKDGNEMSAEKTLRDLIKMSHYTIEIGESSKFAQQINLVLGIKDDLITLLTSDSPALLVLQEITNNQTASDIARGKNKFEIRNFSFIDSLIGAINSTIGWLSKMFGNLAGSIHWREGHLYKNQTALDSAREQLRPMDVLLEKSPFTLTDKFIPGHYGHVAVYLGTKAQLQEIGMWNHPDLVEYHHDIEEGRVILEAVRSGVRLNSLEEFMNIDELTIIRKEDGLLYPGRLIEEITRGMDQIGKAYDFNFDISTLDTIVCSELVYIVYGHVHWPTQYRLGRPTITPDDVAEILFQKGTKFHVQSFMVAKEEHRIEMVDRNYIADELDYELRTMSGEMIFDINDPSNEYWKKETKCYTVSNNGNGSNSNVCKTTYRQFFYDEEASQ